MSTLDELWTWIHSPLHELTAERAGNRDKSWHYLRAHFLERTGLREAAEHPPVEEMIKSLTNCPPTTATRCWTTPTRWDPVRA